MPGLWEIYFLVGLGISAFIVNGRGFAQRTLRFWEEHADATWSDARKMTIMVCAIVAGSALWLPLLVTAFIAGLVAGAMSEWRK